jgi:predicted alpha/beta superfamily hydrolase
MNIVGTIQRHENFPSKFVSARNVDVWLPPGYSEDKQYPVLYMHDGQNIFEPISSFGGVSWEVDQAVTRLMNAGKIPGVIVVGVWNSDIRWREYMPQKPYESESLKRHHNAIADKAGGDPISDSYLNFLVTEIKPFIDSKYRTRSDQRNTFVMGSSMGGLISLYAVSEYPEVFYGAGCLSTHWPAGEHELVELMAQRLPAATKHKLYFDHGMIGLDATYEPFQNQMDNFLQKAGYRENLNWMTRTFEGADHNETAWRARVEIPLSFLLADSN